MHFAVQPGNFVQMRSQTVEQIEEEDSSDHANQHNPPAPCAYRFGSGHDQSDC